MLQPESEGMMQAISNITVFEGAFLALALLSLAAYSACVAALLRHIRRIEPRTLASGSKAPRARSFPSISLLKPIKGDEENLEANLRSLFEQDYRGSLEIVFSSEDTTDPGMERAKLLAQEYPEVRTVFTRAAQGFGMNPKVANLAGALRAAEHDLVLQTDANVRVSPQYLSALVQEYQRSGASLLGSLVCGDGEENVWAALENLQLNAVVAPAMCAADRLMGVTCVVGKAMLFRRSELVELSTRSSRFAHAVDAKDDTCGLEIVRDVLCEDFILGRHFTACERRVALSALRVTNVNQRITFRRFISRHARWLKMRAVIHKGSFAADLACNPVFWATIALLANKFSLPACILFLFVSSMKAALEAMVSRTLRGHAPSLIHLTFVPLKDLVIAIVWLHAAFSRRVVWRGRRIHFVKNSRILLAEGPRESAERWKGIENTPHELSRPRPY